MMNIKNFLMFSTVFFLLVFVSYRIALHVPVTDFSVFYCAGKIVLDPDVPNRMVYDVKALSDCAIPEFVTNKQKRDLFFIYSIPAAYSLSPLALLPYYHAKALLITLDILSYATSVVLLLKNILPHRRSLPAWYLPAACLWLPLQVDILFGQINSIILLLICLAALSTDKRPYLAGFILGIASLFKLFPIGIAFFLGLKNWRIAAVCFLTLAYGVLITGSQQWFTAIGKISTIGATPIHKLLTDYKPYWYAGYALAISGITTLAILSRSSTHLFITAFAITALFILMPVVEYYHLVLLIVPIVYLASNASRDGWLIKITLAISVLLVTVCKYYEIETQQTMMYLSCLLLWAILLAKTLGQNRLTGAAWTTAI